MGYDENFWGRPPMTFRIYVMWALGCLALAVVMLGSLGRPLAYVRNVMVAIWHDALVQPVPDVAPVQIREPGWVLRDYRERMNSERGTDVVDRRVQGGVSGRVIRSSPSQRSFSWSG